MKKILTLLIATGTFIAVSAQSREETRRVIFGEPKDNGVFDREKRDEDRYPVYSNEDRNNRREYEIDRINREYNTKINSIRNNRYLSDDEKARMIRQLERDRQSRINEINRDYSKRYGRYENNDRRERHDNGKHKGWYKKSKNKNWRKGK